MDVTQPQYLVGIDLGTSNCAVAFARPEDGPNAVIQDFAVVQSVRPGEATARPLFPSCLYQPGPELPAGAGQLPWGDAGEWIAGEMARWQGARVPGRLVASAKSWLCHPGVDRSAPILPWGAPEDVRKISPVEASSRLLAHMAAAWNAAHPDAPLAQQEIVVTVPASFDEVARGLTVNAVRQAGLEKFTLLEEPQAAFYDFTARYRNKLARALEGIQLVLVVDVGGGTSDFTLVQVGLTQDGPILRRIAVGEHLMLGGDNMDATLGRKAEERMISGQRKLTMAQWNQLVQGARSAKETLLQQNAPEHVNLSIVSEGSRIIGGSLSARIQRAEAEEIILDGFLPRCGPRDLPHKPARVGLQEVGLPYAQDPAITRHLAAFLKTHAAAGFAALGIEPASGAIPRPDAILLNGGVFNSPKIAARLIEVVSSWWPDRSPIPLLHHESLDLAVARGAAFYGLVRRGMGRRITGGAAHAIYLGLEKKDSPSPVALCVIPRGQEEGETVELSSQVFELTLGKPVRFPLYSTASDRVEKSGETVPITEDLNPLPAIHTVLRGGAGKSGKVPVHLRATLTEIGTLELWCVANDSNQRWRLEFEVRGTNTATELTETESIPASFADARRWIESVYGGKAARLQPGSSTGAPKDVKGLWTSLERTLGPREEWRLPVLRELWGALFAGAGKRRRSADHERVYFQLTGYALRPGFGYALDDWRCEQTASLFSQAVEFHKDKAVWKEFWIAWRRVAGGLSESRQREIWTYLKPYIGAKVPAHPPKNLLRPKGVQPEGIDEMVRLAASLEHLDPPDKTELGDWISNRLRETENASGPWAWALGRLGARTPIYASIHKAVTPAKAREWCELLMTPRLLQVEGSLFAIAQLTRLTGDRTRDVDSDLRDAVLHTLRKAAAPAAWQRMVAEVVTMESADRARALGDTLPAGLTIA